MNHADAHRLSVHRYGAHEAYLRELARVYARTFSFLPAAGGRALADAYAARNPARTIRSVDPLARFPEFLEAHPLARSRSYLVEIARFEREETLSWYRRHVPLPSRTVQGLRVRSRVSFHAGHFAIFDARLGDVSRFPCPLPLRRRRQVLAIVREATRVRLYELDAHELALLRAFFRAALPSTLRNGRAMRGDTEGRARASLLHKRVLEEDRPG